MSKLLLAIIVAVALGAIETQQGEIQKISSSIIRNGSTLFAFHPYLNYWGVVENHYLNSITPYGFVDTVWFPKWPSWMTTYEVDHLKVPIYADVNLLPGDQGFRLYFTGMHEKLHRTAIGVAQKEYMGLNWVDFDPVDEPLLVSQAGEDISQPSLYVEPDGKLSLFYFNSSVADGSSSSGVICRVHLSKDGLKVTGPKNPCATRKQ